MTVGFACRSPLVQHSLRINVTCLLLMSWHLFEKAPCPWSLSKNNSMRVLDSVPASSLMDILARFPSPTSLYLEQCPKSYLPYLSSSLFLNHNQNRNCIDGARKGDTLLMHHLNIICFTSNFESWKSAI